MSGAPLNRAAASVLQAGVVVDSDAETGEDRQGTAQISGVPQIPSCSDPTRRPIRITARTSSSASR